jgi:hypothetical protein
MDIQNYIINLASDMKRFDFEVALNTKLIGKAMDLTNTLSQGVIEMMENVPPPAGSWGSSLDVRA